MGLRSEHMYLDVIAFDAMPAQHDRRIHTLLVQSREYHLQVSPSKVIIGAQQVRPLSHPISSPGVGYYLKKVKALDRMPMLSVRSEARSRGGGFSYQKTFLSNLTKC